MSERRDRRITIGVVLMLVGLAFLVRGYFDFLEGEYVLLPLGAGFLGGYFWKRRYGLMVPAGVLLGLGAGQLLDRNLEAFVEGDQLGLGLGFVSVFLVPLLFEGKARFWPLIPGGFLILAAFEATDDLFEYLFGQWPLLLIGVGALLVAIGWFDRNRSRSD